MKKLIPAFAIVALFFAGCAKEGLDGSATLVVKPAHHGSPISSTGAYRDSVFIKFGVTEVPADPTRDYDALVVGEVGEDHVHVINVKWGDYSIYCTGWDVTLNERVTGGVALKIKRSERKKEIVVNVPVTE
jgi:hypothetical protein